MPQTPVRRDDETTTPAPRERERERAEPARRRGGFLRGVALIVMALVGLFLVAILVLGQLFSSFADFVGGLNPFATQRVDRTQPPVLESIKDLATFDAAQGNFQVIVDLQDEGSRLPDFLRNERVLYVAVGSVDASVDFSDLGAGAVETPTPQSVTITLPSPVLQKPVLDLGASYTFAQERGLIDRLSDLANDDDNLQRDVFAKAEEELADAAEATDLTQRAEDNTTKTLTALLGSLGYTDVTVDFT